MAQLSKSINLQFFINSILIDSPLEWQDIEVLATFDNSNTQGNITTSQFTIVRNARELVKTHIKNGLSGGVGIFEGVPFSIKGLSKSNQLQVFEGFIDLTNEFEDLPEAWKSIITIQKKEGLNNLEQRLSALTYGYLESIGEITDSDYVNIDYVVEKPVNAFELLSTAIITYLLVKELAENIKDLVQNIAVIAGIAISGLTGPAGGAVYAVASAIFQVIYAAAIVAAIISLAQDLINTFISPLRTHKAIYLRELLEKAANHLGLSFNSSISLLDNLVYLPSNKTVDETNNGGFISKAGTIKKGIPNVSDYGYSCEELFSLATRLFYARYAIINGVLEFHPIGSDFWIRNSTYQLPDVLLESLKYNTNDLVANNLLAFDTDLVDTWTIDNFTGTNYEVITDAILTINQEAKYIKGLEEVRFNVCLGNIKTKLNALENSLKALGSLIDSVTSVFGKGTSFASRIKSRVNTLKVSDNNHSKPKLLYLQGTRIPSNNRELFSAKTLWENFHSEKSFITSVNGGQKIVYDNIRIPFGFEDYLKLINNSYFKDQTGRLGKVTKLSWVMGKDYATIDFWIQEKYTQNLFETFIEP